MDKKTEEDEGNEGETIKVFIKEKGEEVSFNQCLVKELYVYFRNLVFKEPVGLKFWGKVFNDFDKRMLGTILRKWYMDAKMENLDFCIRHNMIFSELKLHKMGITENALSNLFNKRGKDFIYVSVMYIIAKF